MPSPLEMKRGAGGDFLPPSAPPGTFKPVHPSEMVSAPTEGKEKKKLPALVALAKRDATFGAEDSIELTLGGSPPSAAGPEKTYDAIFEFQKSDEQDRLISWGSQSLLRKLYPHHMMSISSSGKAPWPENAGSFPPHDQVPGGPFIWSVPFKWSETTKYVISTFSEIFHSHNNPPTDTPACCTGPARLISVAINPRNSESNLAHLITIMEATKSKMGYLSSFVVSVGQLSCFFSTNHPELKDNAPLAEEEAVGRSKATAILSVLGFLKGMKCTSEGDVCDAILGHHWPKDAVTLTAAAMWIHDPPTREWYQRTVALKTRPVDTRLHLLLDVTDGKDLSLRTEEYKAEVLACLPDVSFVHGNVAPGSALYDVDFSKYPNLAGFELNYDGPEWTPLPRGHPKLRSLIS